MVRAIPPRMLYTLIIHYGYLLWFLLWLRTHFIISLEVFILVL